jgi:hypothetical protein
MNVLIRTLPIRNGNYGGLFQAIALSRKIEQMGHSTLVDAPAEFRLNIRTVVKYARALLLLRWNKTLSNRIRNEMNSYFIAFAKKQIEIAPTKVWSSHSKISTDHFQAFIVGSDQVWRPKYGDVERYMFSDLPSSRDRRPRISYAASFGLSSPSEFRSKTIRKCETLLHKFTGISVRESSGVAICDKYFQIAATQVIDPTLLWPKEFYETICDIAPNNSNQDSLLLFTLDRDPNLEEACATLARSLNLPLTRFESKLPLSRKEYKLDPHQFIKKSPAAWVGAIANSKYVVTDSYHGVIFAVIFQKPFITLGNPERGLERFQSLLASLGLTSQLKEKLEDLTSKSFTDINWADVDTRLRILRIAGADFLEESLKNPAT